MNEIRQPSLSERKDLSASVLVKPEGNAGRVDALIAEGLPENPMFNSFLLEAVLERNNMQAALKRVKKNKGAPGIDGMTVDELAPHLKEFWPGIREQLFAGKYKPSPVRKVEIPKPGSKEKRQLGIPTVLDRLIQQALAQVLQCRWDNTFSNSSFGFRPKRSAHQAVKQAQSYLCEGYGFVVDLDLEKFFDRVNHDRLMSTLAKEIDDKRVLKLLRAYLNAGILENGLCSATDEGVPQGGPLSPLLSNIVLDEVDKELELRGHKFVRYADDLNIYVKSERAGLRVMNSVSTFIAKRLKLKVNENKSAVAKPQERKFLGFSFTGGKNPNRRKIAPQAIKRFKDKIRYLTNRNHSMNFDARCQRLTIFLRGWRAYFGFCETRSVLRDLDSWIRRRLRAVMWKQWKVYGRRKSELKRLGLREDLAQTTAWSSKGPWRMSNSTGLQMAFPTSFFVQKGIPLLELK